MYFFTNYPHLLQFDLVLTNLSYNSFSKCLVELIVLFINTYFSLDQTPSRARTIS